MCTFDFSQLMMLRIKGRIKAFNALQQKTNKQTNKIKQKQANKQEQYLYTMDSAKKKTKKIIYNRQNCTIHITSFKFKFKFKFKMFRKWYKITPWRFLHMKILG